MKKSKKSQNHDQDNRESGSKSSELERPLAPSTLSETRHPDRNIINTKNRLGAVPKLGTRRQEHANPHGQQQNSCGYLKTKKRKRPGKKRGGRSMGRYPFITYAKQYLSDIRAYIQPTTLKEREQRLKFIHDILQQLRVNHDITTNPFKMGKKEVDLYLMELDRRGYSNTFKIKLVDILKGYLRYCDNSIMDKEHIRIKLPKQLPKELKPLTEDEIWKIYDAVDRTKLGPWRKAVAKFITLMYPYTGLRPGELQKAQIDDLDIEAWEIYVRHPKGEKRYAKQRTVPLPPLIKPNVLEYLEQRKKYLNNRSFTDAEPLIPSVPFVGKVKYMDGRTVRLIKSEIQKVTKKLYGLTFTLQLYRSSYAQMLKDREVNIEVVSKALGHVNTRNTERFYCRLRDSKMQEEIRNAFKGNNETRKVQSLEIDEKNEMTGYA